MDLSDIGFGLFCVALGVVAPPAIQGVERRRALGLARWVFPADSEDGERPIIHLRASLDEIVFGEHPPTLRGCTHSGDVHAVMDIYKAFEKLPVKLRFDYFTDIDPFMKNIVIVGSSSRSDVSREIGRELYQRGIRVRGEGCHAHYADRSGGVYRCEHQTEGDRTYVTKDAGIIYRRVSETGPTILLCGGIHSFGSQAAAAVALSPEFQRRVRASGLKEFIQYVTVDVASSGSRRGLAIVRQSICWRNLPLEPLGPHGEG